LKILVTGATGFIGSRLVPLLVARDHAVVVVGRDPARLEQLSAADRVVGDLADPRACDGFPRTVDSVVHLAQANATRPTESELLGVNTNGTASLLNYARRAGAASFVFTSSGSVYGGAGRPLRETDEPQPRDPYARSKLAAEELVREHADGFHTCILRLFAPYGPGQQGRLIPQLIARVRDGRPVVLRAGGRPRLTPIYLDHVVDVLEQAIDANDTALVNVAGDEILSIRDMAEAIGRVVGSEPRFEHALDEGQEDLIGDTTALRLQFRLPAPLVTFEQGIEAMIEVSPSVRA
jgi:nucleoside-diphosphate-sugar epimerase